MNQERLNWLKWRKQGIGGSDVPAIYGVSPYNTRMQIYQDKIDPEVKAEESNWATRKGNEFEPLARKQFCSFYYMDYGKKEEFLAATCEMEELPFMRCSLDGKSEDGKTIVEIKFQGKKAHADTGNKDLPIEKRVPRHYWLQCQHNLLISGAERLFYVSYNEKSVFYLEILPDIKFFKSHIKEMTAFWKEVLAKKPPEASDDDVVELKGFDKDIEKWKALKAQSETIEAEMKKLKDKITKACTHPKMTASGVNITLVNKIGNINYKAIPELQGIDLEQYRGKSSSHYKMMLAGEKE